MNQTAQEEEEGGRPWRFVFYLSVVAIILLLGLAILKGYRDLALAQDQVRELQEQEAAALQRVQDLEERLRRVRGDDTTLEELAREELGLARPDDVILVLPKNERGVPEAADP